MYATCAWVAIIVTIGLAVFFTAIREAYGRRDGVSPSVTPCMGKPDEGGRGTGGGRSLAETSVDLCKQVRPGIYDCTNKETKEMIYEEATKGITWYPTEELHAKMERRFWAVTTAYNGVPWQTDSDFCIAANGEDICALETRGEHSCAALLPFNTRLHIPGFGDCVVRDRLAEKYKYRVDIFMGGVDRIQEAVRWGKRRVEVTIIP